MLHVGDEFDHGRYSVMSQLGKGTFGRVVEMWDKAEKRSVAVKVVRAVEKCVALNTDFFSLVAPRRGAGDATRAVCVWAAPQVRARGGD